MVWKSREQIKAHRISTETCVRTVHTKTLPQQTDKIYIQHVEFRNLQRKSTCMEH